MKYSSQTADRKRQTAAEHYEIGSAWPGAEASRTQVKGKVGSLCNGHPEIREIQAKDLE
jgi:hypothetical protein